MKIVTNADDFGYDADTVAATIESFQNGALTSATIMPKMPGTDAAVAFAVANPNFSFGVHLTYVCDTVEAPVGPADRVRSLLRSDGRFLDSQTVRKMALRGRIPISEIEAETAAQIKSLISKGVQIHHVDSHGHLHKFKPFRTALKNVLPQFGITRVRGVQNLFLKKPLRSPTFWLSSWWRRKMVKLFKTTDHFFMPISETGDTTWPARLLPKLSGYGENTSIEVGVHPGQSEQWRQAEQVAISHFVSLARQAGHRLLGWKDL